MAPSILISGAGVAGPVLAFWLHRAGYACTIVERSPVPRTTGQQIDVNGAALKIVRKMGLEEAVRSATVREHGLAFVDSSGRHVAEFPSRSDGASFTSEIEILRGELARVFYGATKDDTEYIWGTCIAGITEVDDGVMVEFASGGPQERKFDLVVAADGMNSRTRRLVFGDDADKSVLVSLGQHMAYFTIPCSESDTHWATWYNAPGGRLIMLRPDRENNRTGAYMAICNSDTPKDYLQLSTAEQMKMWEDLFKDAGGDAERAIKGMYASEDFYMQQIAQVKITTPWSKGRVVLLGDSAFCPSPISGLGASCAIFGAYVLAGELAKHGEDYKAGFGGYEEVMRPVIARAQKVIPGAPQLLNPQSWWGVSLLNRFMGIVSWTGLAGWLQGVSLSEVVDLPEYDM